MTAPKKTILVSESNDDFSLTVSLSKEMKDSLPWQVKRALIEDLFLIVEALVKYAPNPESDSEKNPIELYLEGNDGIPQTSPQETPEKDSVDTPEAVETPAAKKTTVRRKR